MEENKIDDLEQRVYSYISEGMAFLTTDSPNPEKALKCFEKAQRCNVHVDMSIKGNPKYRLLGLLYYRLGDVKKRFFKEDGLSSDEIRKSYTEMFELFEISRKKLERIPEEERENDDISMLSDVLLFEAEVFMKLESIDTALSKYHSSRETALGLYEKAKGQADKAVIFQTLERIVHCNEMIESALRQSDREERADSWHDRMSEYREELDMLRESD